MLPAPLPDNFGNYAIAGIAEVLGPDPVAWLPQTPGWRILGAVIVVLLLRWSFRRYKTWRRNRYRRLALKELGRLEGETPGAALNRIAALLKAVALTAGSREEVAALSGEPWLDWLQAATDRPVFSDSSRRLLASGQYRPAATPDRAALAALIRESATWIRRHPGPVP